MTPLKPASAESAGMARQLTEQAETVFRAFRVIRRRILARPIGMQSLPPSYLELLGATRREPGLRIREAASMLQLASNTVSTMAAQLGDAGLLERRRDQQDRRGVRLFLSDVAEKQLSAWPDQRLELLASVLAGLAPPEREHIVAALPALDRLAEALRRQVGPPSKTTGPFRPNGDRPPRAATRAARSPTRSTGDAHAP